jgi:hypothetical protein
MAKSKGKGKSKLLKSSKSIAKAAPAATVVTAQRSSRSATAKPSSAGGHTSTRYNKKSKKGNGDD